MITFKEYLNEIAIKGRAVKDNFEQELKDKYKAAMESRGFKQDFVWEMSVLREHANSIEKLKRHYESVEKGNNPTKKQIEYADFVLANLDKMLEYINKKG